MKTILGTEIPENIRGVLYLCKFTPDPLSIEVLNELLFVKPFEALEAYADIPNPESQLVTGWTYEELIYKLEVLHKDMKDTQWLQNLAECI